MTAVFLSNGFAWGTWVGNLPRLKEVMGLSATQLGVILFAISAGALLAMAAAGRIAPRLGVARVSGVAGLLLAACLPLPALVPGAAAVLAVALLMGVVTGGMDVCMNARASQVERAWGAAIMSSFHAGWSVGGLLGSGLAALLVAGGRSLRAALALPAIGVAVLAATAFLLGDEPAAPRRRSGFAWPNRAMAALCAVTCLCFAAEGAVADWSGVYLRTVLSAPQARAASVYAWFSLAMVCGRLGGDAVVRRLGPHSVVRLGSMLGVAGLALGLLAPTPTIAACGFATVGLGLANVVPLMFSAAGRARGTVGIAMVATTGYAGLMAAPPFLGKVADTAGLPAALWLVVIGMAGVALLGVARVAPARAEAAPAPPAPASPRRLRWRQVRRRLRGH
jgi:predicted MFS family arabinose efflux permease